MTKKMKRGGGYTNDRSELRSIAASVAYERREHAADVKRLTRDYQKELKTLRADSAAVLRDLAEDAARIHRGGERAWRNRAPKKGYSKKAGGR
jgi:hypothetical protein